MVEIINVAVEKLKPNGRNARTHSRKQVRQIADSITAFGFVNPILVDEEGIIIAGHGRYAAALLLGLKEVPVIELGTIQGQATRACARRQQNR
jgi:ParB-like chromosome segregation protein Spo0J